MFASYLFTTVQLTAQEIEVTFPQYGSTNIALDAHITLHVSAPFIFDTLSLPKVGMYDSLLLDKSIIGFLYEKYNCNADSCLAFSLFMGGFGKIDSVNASLDTIKILPNRDFNYSSNYGILINGLKIINTNNNEIFEIDTIINNLFTTINEPLKYIGTSLNYNATTCKENSITVKFNQQLSFYETEEGPIVSIDTIRYVVDSLTSEITTEYIPISSTFALVNNNKDIQITLNDNFDDEKLYYLNINLSYLTGDERDDVGFSFESNSISRIYIESGPEDDLKPRYDSIYWLKPGRELLLTVPAENENFKFSHWSCLENPLILESLDDSSNVLKVEITCNNSMSEMHFVPNYIEIPKDTIRFILPRNSTGDLLGDINVTGDYSIMDDSTYIFKEGSEFAFCFVPNDTVGFYNWEINGSPTELGSKCVISDEAAGSMSGYQEWSVEVATSFIECNTIELTIDLLGSDDLSLSNNIESLFQHTRISYNGLDQVVTFLPNANNIKKATATLTLPKVNNNELKLFFEGMLDNQSQIQILQPQYEFLSCKFDKKSDQNKGDISLYGSLSRILYSMPPGDKYFTFNLQPGIDNDCGNNIQIVIRPKQCYIEVSQKMLYDESLPNELNADVYIYDEFDDLVDIKQNNINLREFPLSESEKYEKNTEGKIILKNRIFSIPYSTKLKFIPYVEPDQGYEFSYWEEPTPAKKYTNVPVSNVPFTGTLGTIEFTKDHAMRAVYDAGFRLEYITLNTTEGSVTISAESDICFTTCEKDREYLLNLDCTNNLAPNPHYSDGKGDGTGLISFTFNRGLDPDTYDYNDAIKLFPKTLYSRKLLDGYSYDENKKIKTFNSKYVQGDPYTSNISFRSKDGLLKIVDFAPKMNEENYAYTMNPHSEYEITFEKTKLLSELGSTLSKDYTYKVATRFPKYTVYLEKVRSNGSHEGVWSLFCNDDEVYGMTWFGHRNSENSEYIGLEESSDRVNADRLPPGDGYYPPNSTELIDIEYLVPQIGQYSHLGLVSRFYDADCNFLYGDAFEKLAKIIDSLAKNSLVKKWKLDEIFGLGVHLALIADYFCDLNKDDFLGQAWFLSEPGSDGLYWIGNEKQLVDENNNSIGYGKYKPVYNWNYYYKKDRDLKFYYRTILY